MKRFIIGAVAVLMFASVATAQQASTTANSPPPAAGVQVDNSNGDNANGDNGQGNGGWFGWGHHGRHHGNMDGRRGDGGPMMGDGPMGGMMRGKGFHIVAGPGHRLDVNCGDEPIKDCIASSQTLIEAFNKTAVDVKAQ
jgi:hypothetical protein